MNAPLAKFIDRSVLQIGYAMLPQSMWWEAANERDLKLEQAVQFLNGPDFIPAESQPAQLDFMPDATGGRFRFNTIQSRFQTFSELWDRGLRAREEGRPGPFAQQRPVVVDEKAKRPADRILHVTTFNDPLREMDKLQDLYESLVEARREVGEDAIPFHKFADLIKKQVGTFKEKGTGEVAFRVAVKHGKVAFTARAMKGTEDEEA